MVEAKDCSALQLRSEHSSIVPELKANSREAEARRVARARGNTREPTSHSDADWEQSCNPPHFEHACRIAGQKLRL